MQDGFGPDTDDPAYWTTSVRVGDKFRMPGRLVPVRWRPWRRSQPVRLAFEVISLSGGVHSRPAETIPQGYRFFPRL